MKLLKNLKIGQRQRVVAENKNTFQFLVGLEGIINNAYCQLIKCYSSLAGSGLKQVGIYIVAKT